MRDDLAAHLSMGLSEYARRHSAALIIQDKDSLYAGSASCVEIAGRFFLATAAHNLDGIDKSDIRVVAMKDKEATGFVFSKWNRSRKEDLAWIEVDPTEAIKEGLEAVSVDSLAPGVGLRPEHLYMALGVQTESKAKLIKKSPIAGFAKHIGFALKVQGLLTQAVTTQPETNHEFRLKYERQVMGQEGIIVDQRHPGGMSGGGVWSATEQEGLWDPSKCRLLGVIRAFDREDELFAIPIERWLKLVVEDHPELAPILFI